MTTPEQRLARLGIELPEGPAPAAAYVPFIQSGTLVFTAGQLATEDGELVVTGRLGDDLDVDDGVVAARRCAINILAQLKTALGDLGRVRRVVKVTVYVASTPDFTRQHLVANGVSELIGEVLGDAGRHARSALGVTSLPLGSPVEAEAVVKVDE